MITILKGGDVAHSTGAGVPVTTSSGEIDLAGLPVSERYEVTVECITANVFVNATDSTRGGKGIKKVSTRGDGAKSVGIYQGGTSVPCRTNSGSATLHWTAERVQ